MKSKQKWLVAVTIAVLVAPALVGGVTAYQQIRQDSLNRALIVAARRLDAPTVARLLNQGANPNTKETTEQPLTVDRIVKRLIARLQHKAIAKPADEGESVLAAVFTDDIVKQQDREATDTIICALFEHGADFHGVVFANWRPIHLAAIDGLLRTLRLLISHGEVNQRGPYGITPLMIFADAQQLEEVRILLENGADVNAVNDVGQSALYYACQFYKPKNERDKELLRLLIQHGAKLSRSDKETLANRDIPTPPELNGK